MLISLGTMSTELLMLTSRKWNSIFSLSPNLEVLKILLDYYVTFFFLSKFTSRQLILEGLLILCLSSHIFWFVFVFSIYFQFENSPLVERFVALCRLSSVMSSMDHSKASISEPSLILPTWNSCQVVIQAYCPFSH